MAYIVFYTVSQEVHETASLFSQWLARILHEGGRPMLDIYRNYKQLLKK